MSATTLRLGSASDRAFVLDLGRRTIESSVSSQRPAPDHLAHVSYERLVDFAATNGQELIVAENDLDGPVGFLILLHDLPDEVSGLPQSFVAYMAVEPDARRQHIAAQLLAAAETSARARGHAHVALMVTEDNIGARELYAQAGYATERRLLCKTL